MSKQHTPLPWRLKGDKNWHGFHIVSGENDKRICDGIPRKVDAVLLETAPRLLKALIKTADYMGQMAYPEEILSEARSAIADATREY